MPVTVSSVNQVVPYDVPTLASSPSPSSTATAATGGAPASTLVAPSSSTYSSSGIQMLENLYPASAIRSHLSSRVYWGDAASTVKHLLTDSFLGGLAGWLVNYIFTFGAFVSGQPLADQSYATFCAGVMGTTSFFLAVSMAAAQAASLQKLHFLDQPDKHPTIGNCMWRLIRKTLGSYLVSLALTVIVAYLVASLPQETRVLKLHFYIGGLCINFYTVSLDLAYRHTFQDETVEGLARRTTSASTSSSSSTAAPKKRRSYWRLLLQLMVKDTLLLATTYLPALYIHIASSINLSTASALFIFSITSYAFKLVIQEITKTLMLYQKKTDVKTIYVAVAVPTVMIDTQIRALMLRQPNVNQSIAGSIAIAVIEIVFRFLKVWLIRMEIWHHEKTTVRAIVRHPHSTGGDPKSTCSAPSRSSIQAAPSSAGSTGPAGSARQPLSTWWTRGSIDMRVERPKIQEDPRYAEFLHWRRRLLRFHAAEIHADMYAEYLAIACSMSIYFFFHDHPKYEWTVAASSTTSTAAATSTYPLNGKQQAIYLVVQVAMEMVVDIFSCLWELVNGVPMHNSKQMRGFITALFACCSIANIVVSAAMYVRSTPTD